ncbi:MAG: phosphoribosylformylglycinamidine synthase subunit PurS [Acetobacteraceae bacterium]
MKIRVDVVLREGVLDPQGKAIGHALETLDFKNVSDVRVGKTILLDVDCHDTKSAADQGRKMAEALLANLVIEDYTVEVVK